MQIWSNMENHRKRHSGTAQTFKPLISRDEVKLEESKKTAEINSTGPILWRLANFQFEPPSVSSSTPYDPNWPWLLTILTF